MIRYFDGWMDGWVEGWIDGQKMNGLIYFWFKVSFY
jgi:hypothetical protein